MIEASLSSSFTRFNFFIHNLAQLRFHGTESEKEKKSLSFAPEIRSCNDDQSKLVSASIVGYQKRYNPEKFYMYCVKVTREVGITKTTGYIFRTYKEFEELHSKLAYAFTSSQLPWFSKSVVIGRQQVKQVAERRKMKLNQFLDGLFRTPNVARHDLVYTFFHPILRDEEVKTPTTPKSQPTTPLSPMGAEGEVKMSIHYKNNALFILIIHCKNLPQVYILLSSVISIIALFIKMLKLNDYC